MSLRFWEDQPDSGPGPCSWPRSRRTATPKHGQAPGISSACSPPGTTTQKCGSSSANIEAKHARVTTADRPRLSRAAGVLCPFHPPWRLRARLLRSRLVQHRYQRSSRRRHDRRRSRGA